MARWSPLLSVLLAAGACTSLVPLRQLPLQVPVQVPVQVLNTTVANTIPRAQFYLLASRPVKLNLTTCAPAVPPTCALNDLEASYVVQRTVQRSGRAHGLLNARTVRTELALQAAAGQLNGAAGRQAALDLSAAVLANTTSTLLDRPLSLQEANHAGLVLARNVPRCVLLTAPTVLDMWAGFVYREAQQVNYTYVDPIGQFVTTALLFLAQEPKPANRPDPLKFAQFVRARLALLAGNMCTEVPATPVVSPQLVPLTTHRQVYQLVTIWHNGTVVVKDVERRIKGVPLVLNGNGNKIITPTSG